MIMKITTRIITIIITTSIPHLIDYHQLYPYIPQQVQIFHVKMPPTFLCSTQDISSQSAISKNDFEFQQQKKKKENLIFFFRLRITPIFCVTNYQFQIHPSVQTLPHIPTIHSMMSISSLSSATVVIPERQPPESRTPRPILADFDPIAVWRILIMCIAINNSYNTTRAVLFNSRELTLPTSWRWKEKNNIDVARLTWRRPHSSRFYTKSAHKTSCKRVFQSNNCHPLWQFAETRPHNVTTFLLSTFKKKSTPHKNLNVRIAPSCSHAKCFLWNN